jgi:membrane-bound lytic murein transglycosylase D
MKFTLIFTFLLIVINFGFSQTKKPKPIVKDSTSSQHFISVVEQTLENFYTEYANNPKYNKIFTELENDTYLPEFSDEEICAHLKKMNELSPYKLDCNQHTLSTIRFFQKNRRSFIKIALGRSKLYFDMYEEILAKHDLPIDLKFLSVIESGLRPQVKSHAGALGLWQFMYGTGKMFHLEENSYIDERMDPRKSTEAACKYLKKLHGIYGDWNLALAAYNAGPGNINKAIRRSGGKTSYWEVRPFLPRETQGYVPNFVAAAYLMTFYVENKLKPAEISIHVSQIDTVCFKSGVHMETISNMVNWDLEEIKKLNPVYKRTYIPQTYPNQCIAGPLTKIGKIVSLEDSIYNVEKRNYGTSENLITRIVLPNSGDTISLISDNSTINQKFIYHKVRKGETISKIANKYNVTNRQILDWNNLRSNSLPAGKLIKIIQKEIAKSENSSVNKINETETIQEIEYYDTVVSIYHLVKRNETIFTIANLYNITVEDLKRWNNLSDNILNIDQKLMINSSIQLSRAVNKTVPKAKTIAPVSKEVVEKSNKPQYYTIRSGDLFNRIAQKHNLSMQELIKLNPNVNPDRISVGQKLRVK